MKGFWDFQLWIHPGSLTNIPWNYRYQAPKGKEKVFQPSWPFRGELLNLGGVCKGSTNNMNDQPIKMVHWRLLHLSFASVNFCWLPWNKERRKYGKPPTTTYMVSVFKNIWIYANCASSRQKIGYFLFTVRYVHFWWECNYWEGFQDHFVIFLMKKKWFHRTTGVMKHPAIKNFEFRVASIYIL